MYKKTQSSLEFLMIFGIGFTIILILSGIFFTYFNEEKDTLDSKHIENIGNEITKNVEKIYFLGTGNRITINTNFPDGIENITIVHKNNVNVGGELISYDYLNVTYIIKKSVETQMFETKENYIRFNCSQCTHNTITNVSYFEDPSYFSGGNKKIRVESKGDFVEISFVR